MKIPMFDHYSVQPFRCFGLTHAFWHVHIDTLMYTWIAMAILLTLCLVARMFIRKKTNLFVYLLKKVVIFFSDLCSESCGALKDNYTAFVASLFLFTFFSTLTGVIPFLGEATKDLNTTLAIAISSFLYIEREDIRHQGLWPYIKHYFQPFFLLLPLNLIEKCAKIVSMSFRLFGNILGGSIIFYLLIHVIKLNKTLFLIILAFTLLGYWCIQPLRERRIFTPLRWALIGFGSFFYSLAGIEIFFGVVEGLIQAFVISMLTITYLSVVSGGEEDEHHYDNT